MGGVISSFYNPSIRDQAITRGLFARVSDSDQTDPLFTKYDIRFKEIETNVLDDDAIFAGATMDSIPFTKKDFNDTVCEISYSSRCRLVPVPSKKNENNEDKYDLVDVSGGEPRKLIRVHVVREENDKNGNKKYFMKYQIFQQP